MKRITKKELDSRGWVALEDILAFVNGGKYDKFFRDSPRAFKDGSKEYLTRRGASAYGRLVSILYACARVVGNDETSASVEELVEELDDVITEE